jgi:hypothetical protein
LTCTMLTADAVRLAMGRTTRRIAAGKPVPMSRTLLWLGHGSDGHHHAMPPTVGGLLVKAGFRSCVRTAPEAGLDGTTAPDRAAVA